jgi:ribosomal protein S18 acetylase RimI-like enzyme
MPEIEIRPVSETDIPFLSDLEHAYTSEYAWQMDMVRPQNEGTSAAVQVNFREIRYPHPVRVEYPRPSHALLEDWETRSGILVATLAEEPIGYISLALDKAPETAWITDLVVRRSLHRKGIGSALLLAGLEWAANHDCRKVVIELQQKNVPGIRLAQKIGFEFSGFLDHYFSNNDIGLFFTKTIWY